MATPVSTSLLPMWRSPTASSCTSSRSYALQLHDSWDDDDVCSTTTSPTRMVQCLNFLSQVERIELRARHRARFHDPVFQLDVFLTEDTPGNTKPTYQIERTLAEFAQLRDDVVAWTTRDAPTCSFCVGFQKRSAAWEQHWPRRRLHRFFRFATAPNDFLLQQLLDDVLELSRSQLRFDREPCSALQEVPTLVTRFLVHHELTMDD